MRAQQRASRSGAPTKMSKGVRVLTLVLLLAILSLSQNPVVLAAANSWKTPYSKGVCVECRDMPLWRPFSTGTQRGRCVVTAALVLVLVLGQPLLWSSEALAQQNNNLRVAVVEGNNRIVKKDGNVRLVVEVRDDSRAPVFAAEVTFIAPEFGPGTLFAGNVNRLTVRTDAHGRASADSVRVVGGDGPFTVKVLALAQGSTATADAQLTNQTEPSSNVKKKSSKLWIVIAAVGGAAVAALALKGKSDSGSSSGSGGTGGGTGGGGTVTVTPGTPTVGGPQ